MTFLAVGWLGLFAPFVAVVVWTLRRMPTVRPTTSAFLWPSNPIASSIRSRRRPPAWTIAALASMGCAILALAAPATRTRARVFVVVDPSFRVALGPASMASNVWKRLKDADVEPALVVPGQPDAMSIVDVRPTARTTAADVVASVARLTRSGRDVVVISAVPIKRGEHVCTVGLPSMLIDASIGAVGARTRADGAVDIFVRLERTPSSPTVAMLFVRSGESTFTAKVTWTGDSTEVTAIVRLARAEDVIEARVEMAGDAVSLDDVARLNRDASSNVRLTLDGTLPAAVQRFAATYARVRPADHDRRETMVTISSAAGAGRRIMISDGSPSPLVGDVRRSEHPVLRNVNLDRLPASDAPMPSDLKAIAWRGGRPIVAVRDVVDDRAVWLGLAVDASSRETSWIVLLDQAIAWTAGSDGEEWSSVTSDAVPLAGWHATAVGDARVDASPGAYVDAEGHPRAVNLPAGKTPAIRCDNDDLPAWLAARDDRERRSLAAVPAGFAAAFAIVAATLAITSRRGRPHLDVRALAT